MGQHWKQRPTHRPPYPNPPVDFDDPYRPTSSSGIYTDVEDEDYDQGGIYYTPIGAASFAPWSSNMTPVSEQTRPKAQLPRSYFQQFLSPVIIELYTCIEPSFAIYATFDILQFITDNASKKVFKSYKYLGLHFLTLYIYQYVLGWSPIQDSNSHSPICVIAQELYSERVGSNPGWVPPNKSA